MNELPELVRAGADDWLFILFVIFAIAAQAIDANRKKKLAEQRKAAGKGLKPSAPSRTPSQSKAPQEELDSFLKMLGARQEEEMIRPAAEPRPERSSMMPPPRPQPPMTKAPVKPRGPSAKKRTAEQDFKKRYSGANRIQKATESIQAAQKEAVSSMLHQSRSLVMNMQGVRMPTIQAGPSMTTGHKAHATFDINLKNRNELRRAILNQEILGKPKAMDPYR